MKQRMSWISIISGVLLLSASAYASYYPELRGVEIVVVADNGRVFPLHEGNKGRHGDTYRAYIEAIDGEEYGIRVRNNTPDRIGVVIAVDGRNIISGAKSHLKRHERMYILKPYQQTTYRGWRTSQRNIQRFFFTDAGNSYADAWGDRSAMGVIAAAVYREKRYQYDRPLEYRSQRNRSMDSAAQHGAHKESQPGTGFGDKEYSPATRVHFEAEKKPLAKVFYKYEWRSTLCKHGVIHCRPKNRFWPDEDFRNGRHLGFVPYPPGYYWQRDQDRNWK